MWSVLVFSAAVGVLVRLLLVWPRRGKAFPKSGGHVLDTLVVLGSGGHTAEILPVAHALDTKRYRIHYVAADERSRDKVGKENVTMLPRARSVGESWTSSLLSFSKAMASSVVLMMRRRPHVLLCNGPAICVPLALCALLLRLWGGRGRVCVIFIESGCRVERLSLSGRIMYHLSDVFFVQWPQLANITPQSICIGRTL